MGRSPEVSGGQPPLDGSYRFVNCIDGVPSNVTPVDAMNTLKGDPQAAFPFPIDGADGKDEIEVGRTFNLRPLFLDAEPVTVTAETPTSFTFEGEEDHLRGDGALLTFTTFRNAEGDICLEQSAKFQRNIMTPVLDFGSKIMWKIQTSRLGRVLIKNTSKV